MDPSALGSLSEIPLSRNLTQLCILTFPSARLSMLPVYPVVSSQRPERLSAMPMTL